MKSLLRNYFINLGALWATTQILPALSVNEGIKGFLIGALAFMVANITLVPALRILLLPLNLLTLGLFTWLSNVLALYILVTVIPQFQISPYHLPSFSFYGFTTPPVDLTTLQVVVAASFLIGILIHVLHWLIK